MPAAVIEATFDVDDQEVSIVRNTLKQISDDDRQQLWQLLDLLNRIDPTDSGCIRQAVALAPYGPIRECVARIAHLRAGIRSPIPMPTPASAATAGYKRPPLVGITGRAADHDTWTAGWTWRSFAPEALEAVADRRYRKSHTPTPVLYRHAGDPIGLTQAWWLTDSGDLDTEIMVLPHTRAQTAARHAQDGLLPGLSVGARTLGGEWIHLSPSEWEPRTGDLDLSRSHQIRIEEISLTPAPAQPGSRVRSVW